MSGLVSEPCGCAVCEARRTEHPPARTGCPCRECQPGPGLDPIARSEERLSRVLGPVTTVVTLDWCMICREIVEVSSVRSGPGWINTCKSAHTWRSFD